MEKERAKWEEREARLLAQLNEVQSRMVEEQGRGGQEFQDNLSYSNWEEEDEGGHLFQDSGAARARVYLLIVKKKVNCDHFPDITKSFARPENGSTVFTLIIN